MISDKFHLISFVDRMSTLRNTIPTDHPYIQVVPAFQCRSKAHLETFYHSILDKKGEGVMLRTPNSPYEVGRSSHLLKYKVTSRIIPTNERLAVLG